MAQPCAQPHMTHDNSLSTNEAITSDAEAVRLKKTTLAVSMAICRRALPCLISSVARRNLSTAGDDPRQERFLAPASVDLLTPCSNEILYTMQPVISPSSTTPTDSQPGTARTFSGMLRALGMGFGRRSSGEPSSNTTAPDSAPAK